MKTITRIERKFLSPAPALRCMHCQETAVNVVKFSGEYANWTLYLCPVCSGLPETELIKIVKEG